jgi:transposase, IS30 family
MGKRYGHITLEERCEISRRVQAGETNGEIAAALGRSASSISRELSRNGGVQGYKPAHAGDLAWARRWRGSKLERDEQLQALVLDRLGQGWSPEQVSGRLAREAGKKIISYESIYRFVYAQIRRTNDFTWRHYLPRGKFKRGFRGKKGGSPALHIKHRISLDNRPAEIADRREPGHWEADLISFSAYGQILLAAHERTSRLMLAARQPTKQADPVAEALKTWLEPLPQALRRTITFDNGTEFAAHDQLHELKIQTFFCDPHAPWQKGGVENAIGRLRRQLPRKTNLDSLTSEQIFSCVRRYNHTPRRCLGFRTPAEAYTQLLHLEFESTSPPSRG